MFLCVILVIYRTRYTVAPAHYRKLIHVRHLLQSIGFNNVWMNQGVGSVDLFIRILKERLNDNFIQNWNSELKEFSRARTYVQFCNFRPQPYLTCITLEKFRTSLSRWDRKSIEVGGHWPLWLG